MQLVYLKYLTATDEPIFIIEKKNLINKDVYHVILNLFSQLFKEKKIINFL